MLTSASFAVGDQVIHPHHGPGRVTVIKAVDLGAGPVPYVTIEIDGGLTVKVPSASVADVGIREPVTAERAEAILASLAQPAADDPGHLIRRQRDTDKIGGGNLIECAEVVRDLTAIVALHKNGGNHADRRMLETARKQLAAELSLVLGATPDEVLVRIDDALNAGAGAAA